MATFSHKFVFFSNIALILYVPEVGPGGLEVLEAVTYQPGIRCPNREEFTQTQLL